jgi:hypothetical protein
MSRPSQSMNAVPALRDRPVRRIQMRKTGMLAAALILIAVGAWAITTTPRVVASTPVGIDPFQMMTNARGLPAAHYVDYSLVFN